MSELGLSPENINNLILLLERRLTIIGDSQLRETDPDSQLEQLKEVSEKIFSAQSTLSGSFSPRLRHFFEGCSYDKALAHLKACQQKA
jgi:hypothetical protein